MVVYETVLFLTRAVAAVCLVAWLYLFFARGFFWRIKPAMSLRRDGAGPLPPVAVIVPARNEAAHIGQSIGSLLNQDYSGPFHIFVVDDHSTDGTADIARGVTGADDQLSDAVAGMNNVGVSEQQKHRPGGERFLNTRGERP